MAQYFIGKAVKGDLNKKHAWNYNDTLIWRTLVLQQLHRRISQISSHCPPMLKNRVFIIQIRYENSICQEGTQKMTLTTRVVNLVKEKAPHANLRVEALDWCG